MNAARFSSDMQLEELIEHAKVVRPLPPLSRARVLKRAQASALSGLAPSVASDLLPSKGNWSRAWFSGAACATLFAAAAALAIHGREPVTELPNEAQLGEPAVVASAPLVGVPSASAAELESEPEPEPALPAPSALAPSSVKQPARPAESYAGELELLRRAHAAFAGGDFSTALRLLAEHARRFPSGRLAEEREALRVRALSSSGQGDAARRAAEAFAARFPRSVLLSRTLAAAGASK